MTLRFLSLLFLVILLSSLVSGCAEFLEDYSYSTGADTVQNASDSGTRDPFKDYGSYGPSSTSEH